MTVPGGPFDARVDAVVAELGGVATAAEGTARELRHRGLAFAVVDVGRLEVRLGPAVAAAALRTPNTSPSTRGAGWIVFAPGSDASTPMDLDRAEAWLRFAHRQAGGA